MAADIANDHYASAASTAATFTGPWIDVSEIEELAFQIKLAGTSSPTSTWSMQGTMDRDPAAGAPLGPVAIALPSAYSTAGNPAGDGANIATVFSFGPGQAAPMPCTKWVRLILTRASGGAASCLNVGVTGRRKRS